METDWTKLQAFFVGVPHRLRPFVVSKRYAERDKSPDTEAGDTYFEGDHDLSGVYVVGDQATAESLLDPHDHNRPGGQARHQAIAIACLVRVELESQGVLEPDDEEEETE